MNPALNSTLQRNVNTSTSPLVPTSAHQNPQNDTSRELSETPSLTENSQSLDLKQVKEGVSFKLDLDRIKKILGKLRESSVLSEMRILEKNDLEYIVQALFFSQGNNHTECFLDQIYKDPSLNELLPVFEEVIDKLIFNITTHSISNGLPSKPEGEIDLNAILDLLCNHLSTVKDCQEHPAKTSAYLQLYFVLGAYYEAPASAQAFPEYSKKRISKLEKLISCLGPLYVKECALLNEGWIRVESTLFKFCKDSPSHLLKLKQDFACWLMTSLNFDKDERSYQLLILDFLNDVFQKSNIKTAFHKQGIDLDKELLSDPMFVSCMLRADCAFFQNTGAFKEHKDTLTDCDSEKARVHLLQKLERLGLKPEIINKHHPILELALELKDPELLRHLILEYKFNPYYISDTTGYSLWQLLTQPHTHYSDDFKHELAYILKHYDIKYYIVNPEFILSNQHVEEISFNHRTTQSFDINLQNQWGETALIRVAKFGLDATHLFAMKELDLTLKDHTGKTALDYARENNNKPLAALIEEHKREQTIVKLIDTVGANGKKDNYQRLIAFLHKKGNDTLSPIEKAYQTQNILIIESIEAHLPAISLYFGEYASTAEGKKVQPLNSEYVLQYLKTCFAKNPPEALTKLRLYTYYYYCMQAYIGFEYQFLNKAIHSLIALIPDVREVDTFSQDLIGGLINLFAKLSNEAQAPKKEANRYYLENIARKAYRNVAHFLVSPFHIKNQSHSSFIVSFLNPLSIRAIHSQEEVSQIGLYVQSDFFNSIPFLTDILMLCKQNLSGYRPNSITIIQKLKELGCDLHTKSGNGHTLLHLAIEFEEIALFKHLILEEKLDPFRFNIMGETSWSCASYCRNPKNLSSAKANPAIKAGFHKLWMEEIEPVLLQRYQDSPPHSPENPRVDLIAQRKIAATPKTINLQNQWGETPLIFAAKYGYDVERLLKISGIDIQKKDDCKKTAMNYAVENQDLVTQNMIKVNINNEIKSSLTFSKINELYQKKLVDKVQNTTPDISEVKKLSKRQVAQLKADQERLQKQEKEALKKQKQAKPNPTQNLNIPSKTTQKPSPATITITVPELLDTTDNFVYQEPVKELSHKQKAKEQEDKKGKKKEAKQKKSLLGRVVSGAKELKSTIVTAVNIVKDPSKAGTQILKQAVERLATSKAVSTRVKAQDKPLLKYPELLELLDLVQAQDPDFQVARNIQTILEAIDTALNAHYKNPYISFPLQQIETVLQCFYPDMTLSQHGSHRTYHFQGMKAITLATHEENKIFKKALQDVGNRIREALLKKLGIQSYDVSGPAHSPSFGDAPRAESKDESSEEEKSGEFSS